MICEKHNITKAILYEIVHIFVLSTKTENNFKTIYIYTKKQGNPLQ